MKKANTQETIDKKEHMKRSLRGLYAVVAFGVGIFFILLNVILRGGWFVLLSIFLIILLVFIVLYIILMVLALLLLQQPETVVLDEKGLEERLKLRKQENEKRGEGEGIHIRFGRTKK